MQNQQEQKTGKVQMLFQWDNISPYKDTNFFTNQQNL